MLQYQTVTTSLLRVLNELMKIPEFTDLLLVGGTGLALQLGHRKSIDIDLFGKVNFEYENLTEELTKIGKLSEIKRSKNINIYSIDGIKVDFVNYKYKWINKNIKIDNIRLASLEDIAAMKLNAICGRGTKKDFIDIYFLLQRFSFSKMFDFYRQKFDDGNILLVKKSLLYFKDAEYDELPQMSVDFDWNNAKQFIINTYKKEFQ